MDAVKGFFVWPFVSLFQHTRFVIGLLISLPVLVVTATSNGRFSTLFQNLKGMPLGKYVFSGIVPFFAPYTANISATVEELSSENCKITMQDWPWLRNPYSSIHAIALANLGEFSSGLLMISLLQDHKKLRGIPVRITTEYYHKARGLLHAVSVPPKLSMVTETQEIESVALIYDRHKNLVSKTTVAWTVSVKEDSEKKKSAGSGNNSSSKKD